MGRLTRPAGQTSDPARLAFELESIMKLDISKAFSRVSDYGSGDDGRTVTGTAIVFGAKSRLVDFGGPKGYEIWEPGAEVEFAPGIRLTVGHQRQQVLDKVKWERNETEILFSSRIEEDEGDARGRQALADLRLKRYGGASVEFYIKPGGYVEERLERQGFLVRISKAVITGLSLVDRTGHPRAKVVLRNAEEDRNRISDDMFDFYTLGV